MGVASDLLQSDSVCFLYNYFQGESGKVGMPGFPGSDGVPVSMISIITFLKKHYLIRI